MKIKKNITGRKDRKKITLSLYLFMHLNFSHDLNKNFKNSKRKKSRNTIEKERRENERKNRKKE